MLSKHGEWTGVRENTDTFVLEKTFYADKPVGRAAVYATGPDRTARESVIRRSSLSDGRRAARGCGTFSCRLERYARSFGKTGGRDAGGGEI